MKRREVSPEQAAYDARPRGMRGERCVLCRRPAKLRRPLPNHRGDLVLQPVCRGCEHVSDAIVTDAARQVAALERSVEKPPPTDIEQLLRELAA